MAEACGWLFARRALWSIVTPREQTLMTFSASAVLVQPKPCTQHATTTATTATVAVMVFAAHPVLWPWEEGQGSHVSLQDTLLRFPRSQYTQQPPMFSHTDTADSHQAGPSHHRRRGCVRTNKCGAMANVTTRGRPSLVATHRHPLQSLAPSYPVRVVLAMGAVHRVPNVPVLDKPALRPLYDAVPVPGM